ncbi:integrator complex subunit 12 [Anabrus simplex]|uniref:integrator complex subunit 12 n=1 Tax=Anabrus simplex TaxID=316456 RepID=UPI0034DD31EE
MTAIDASDAIFRRGILLLNSSADGSMEQLRGLLEDTIKQRYGSSRSLNIRKDSYVKKESSGKSSTGLTPKKEGSKKYSEKRSTLKSSEDRTEGSRDGSSSRKSVDQHKTSLLKPSSSNPASPHSLSMGMSQSVSMSLLRDLETGKEESLRGDDDEDLALEILEEDLTCVVCRGMDVGVRNQLVECLECHSLYHQECHQPPVPDDMNEPRSAWYCANCMKAMNKVGTSSSSSSNSILKGGTSGTNVSAASVKSHISGFSKFGFITNCRVFRGYPPPVKAPPSTSKSGPSSSSRNSLPKINIVSADKRLAIMKKKAAKLQEKRKLTK